MTMRAEWDLDPEFLTVNHGSFGATPRCVRDAQRAWQDRMESQPTRFMNQLPEALRRAAGELGRFLNVPADTIAFVDNATGGCNAVLRSLGLQAGEEILVLNHGYGAVRNAVSHVAGASGVRVVEAKLPFPDPTPESLLQAVTDALTPRTRLAVIDHITSGSALVLPVAAIVAACHVAGVQVLVEGAHAPGQIDLDLSAIGADWYVGNCHKWLCAPKGCGFLHAPVEHQSALHPVTISHGYRQGFVVEFDWTGTTDPSRFLAVTAALDFHARLGGVTLRQRNRTLALQAAGLMVRRLSTGVGAGPDVTAAMATIRLPVTASGAAKALAIRQALLAAGTDAPVHALGDAVWLRLSAFAYNEADDYQRLADLVAGVLRAGRF